MKSRPNIFQFSVVAAILSGIVVGVFAAVTLGILAGGWLVNWMFPTIPYEFASVIAGQGLFIAGLVLAYAGYSVVKVMERQEFQDEVTDDDDEDDDSAEAAEWLAERIADITHAKLTQTAPRSRRYTVKPRGK